MAHPPVPLEYAPAVRRRSPARALLACFLWPLPFALALLLLIGLDRPATPPVPPGTFYAYAEIVRGNVVGDYRVTADGFMRGGRPVFERVSVYFPTPGGRSLDVDPAKLTFHPFADSVSPGDYRPVTRAAMFDRFTSQGCDPASPATGELADALYADLQKISAGTPPPPPQTFRTGLYVPRPDDPLLTPRGIVIGWLAVSCLAAFVRFLVLWSRENGARN